MVLIPRKVDGFYNVTADIDRSQEGEVSQLDFPLKLALISVG
jgi:hypothetical protein